MNEQLVFASPADRADAGAFLARVVRLDPAALVRVRASGGSVGLWAWLPLDVLVSRSVRGGAGPSDATVAAKALLDAVTAPDAGPVPLPPLRDADWRGALPAATGAELLDEVPADVIARLVGAAEKTFREASATADPRAVGEGMLDQDTLTVTAGDRSAGIPLRVLLALARMGFLGTDPVQVALLGTWVRVSASFGVTYLRRGDRLALFTAT